MHAREDASGAEPPARWSGAAVVGSTLRWPLVGRRDLVTALAAQTARGVSIVVDGPAGAGRTRLLAAVADAFAGPVITVAEVEGGRAGTAGMPGRSGAAAAQPAGREEMTLAEARSSASGWLRDRADGEHLLLTVDDVHLLDPTTALGVGEVVRDVPWTSVLMTMPHGRSLPASMATSLGLDACRQVRLDPLDDPTMDALARAVLGGPVEAGLLADLRRRCDGLPRTAVQLLLGAREAGVIRLDGDTWRAEGELPIHRVSSVIDRLLAAADGGGRADAELIALGEPLPAEVVGELLPPGRLGALAHLGIVRWQTSDGRRELVLAHPVYGEVLRARIDPADRGRMVQRLVAGFTVTPSERDIARVAAWQLEIGDDDPGSLVDGARASYAVGDHHLAARLGRAAVEGGAGHTARVDLAATLTELGQIDEVRGLLDEAEALEADDRQRVRTALVRAHSLWTVERDEAAARAILAEVEQRTEDPAMLPVVVAYTALMDACLGRVLGARDRLGELDLGGVAPVGPGELEAKAHLLGGVAAAIAWDELPGDAVLARWLREPPGDGDGRERILPVGPSVLEVHRLLSSAGSDDEGARVAERAQLATDRLESSLRQDREDVKGLWLAVVGRLELARGDVTSARSHLGDAAATLRRADSLRIRPLVLCLLAVSAVRGGAPTGARRWLEQLGSDREQLPRVAAWAALADAEVVAAEVGPAPAIELAVSAGDAAVDDGLDRSASAAFELVIRLGDGARVLDRLRELVERRPTRHGDRLVRAATAVAGQDGPAIEEAAIDLAASGRRLLAAELAVQADGHGANERTAALAAGLRTGCPGAATPALVGVEPVEVPRRARELARRGMAGLTSAELAEEFDLSVRTVDNQLGRVYREVGVHGRRQLTRCYSASVAPFAEDPPPTV